MSRSWKAGQSWRRWPLSPAVSASPPCALRAVARLADACNIVDGEIAEVRDKLDKLRGDCDELGRDYDTIEKTRVQPWLLAHDDVAVAAKRNRLAARGPVRGFVGTVSEAIDLIGEYQDAGIDLLINADRWNDVETRELFASDVMPHFVSTSLSTELSQRRSTEYTSGTV